MFVFFSSEQDDQIRQLEKELEDANELIEAMKKKGE